MAKPKQRARPRPQIKIEELVQFQQDCVGRIFDFWANAATRVMHGNFSVRDWADEYATVLEDSIDTYGSVLKKVFGMYR
jgi:hypothetical protein